MRLPKREGFTVIELLTTLMIVAVLATIALNFLWRAKDRGLQSALQSDLKSLAIQQESYFAVHREYGADLDDLAEYATSPGVLVTVTHAAADGWSAVAVHPSLGSYQCGIMYGTVPAGAAPPAVRTGVVTCGEP